MTAEWTANISVSVPEEVAAASSLSGLAYADAEGNFVCTISWLSTWAPEEGNTFVGGGMGSHGTNADYSYHGGVKLMCTGAEMTCTSESWACSTVSEDPDAEPFDFEATKEEFTAAVGDADAWTAAEENFAAVCPMNPGTETLVSSGMNADEPPTGAFEAMWSKPMGDMKVGDTGEFAWAGMGACLAEGEEEPHMCAAWITDMMPITVVQGAAAVQVASAALAAYLLF